MAGRDIGAALFLLIGAALLIRIVIPAETIPGDEGELAQAFMPTLAAVTIAAAASLVLIRAVAARFRDSRAAAATTGEATHGGPEREAVPAEPEQGPIDRVFWMVLAGGALLFVLVLALVGQLGYLIGSGATILLFGLAFNRDRRAWVSIIALAVLLPPAAHVLVLYGLGLALP